VFKPGKPRLLFEGRYDAPAVRSNYDVTADDQHFIMVKSTEPDAAQLHVIVNWVEELKQRVRASDAR
jgi:hypothetical protein